MVLSKVLITGGTGFIGSYLVRELLHSDYDVTVMDINQPGELLKPMEGKYIFVQADFLNINQANKYFKDTDVVFHLGALVGRLISAEKPYDSVRINIEGTMNVLDMCRKNDVKKLIFSSTSEVLGEMEGTSMDESHPLNPVTPYGIAKLAAEKFCLLYHRWYGMDIMCPRFFNVYGVGEHPSVYRSVVSRFIWEALNDRPLVVDRGCTRTFQYVTDLAKGCRLLLEKGRAGEVYHLSGDYSITIEDLAKTILRLSGKQGTIRLREPTPMDVRVKIPSNRKARFELGYVPKVGLEEGLTKTIKWQRELMKR